jgi:hypothetical protein
MVELRKSNGDTLEYHNVSVHVNANAILSQMHSMASADTHIWEAIFGNKDLCKWVIFLLIM